MKRLLLFLFCLGSLLASNAQFPATNLKQNFKWGAALGTRDSTAYGANDSLVVVINRQGRMMYRSTDGFWKVLANSNDSAAILSQVVRTFGPQMVGGAKTFTADTTRFNISVSNKQFNGGADTLFSDDIYTSPYNATKTGFIHHYYGISDNQNGGGDITYFKENGVGYQRVPNVADRRVLPNSEIWYEQYSAHNGVDNIYSRRSIAVITAARVSSNSTLGNMRGWYEIVTARDSGYKTTPTFKDLVIAEGKIGINVPSVLTANGLTSTANVYGDLYAENGIISNKLTLRNSPALTNWETYVNGTVLAKKVVGSSFDNFQLRNGGARPLLVRSSGSNPPVYLYNDASGGGLTMSDTQLTGYYQTSSQGQFHIANNEIVRFNNAGGARWGVGTGNTINATLHARGNASTTAAFLVTNNSNAELFRINNAGGITASTGFTGQRGNLTSLVLNKDSVLRSTTNLWAATVDTITGRLQRREISLVHTGSIAFDTTARTLTINQLGGGTTSVVIPRGSASGSSGITALSSSRSGNLVTVSGDNGSSTIFSIRDADSTTRENLTPSYGISGSAYNGAVARTWAVDTTQISTKANVTALLTGYATTAQNALKLNISDTASAFSNFARLSGATFTDTIKGTVGIFEEKLTAKNTISVKNAVDTPTVQISWTGTDNGVVGVYSSGGAAKIALVGNGTSYLNGGKVLIGTTTESPNNEEFQVGGAALVSGSLKASSFARIGGTSSQFQMGDGSVITNVNSAIDTGRAAAQIVTGGSLNKVRDSITATTVNLIGNQTVAGEKNFTSVLKSSGLIQPITLKTANYTLTANDHTVIFDCAAANRTVTLPVGVEGQIFVIKAKNASTNAAIITPNGSQTIEGNSTYSLSNTCGDAAITIQFFDGNWNIISSYIPPCL